MKRCNLLGGLLGLAFIWFGAMCPAPCIAQEDIRKAMLDRMERAKQFKEIVKTAKDPVALAVEAARDHIPGHAKQHVLPTPLSLAGMDVLAEYWQDDRSEKVLAQIAESDRHWWGDAVLTAAGAAAQRLKPVRAKRAYRDIMAGAETNKERYERIRKQFTEHPEWLGGDESKRNVILVARLINEAIDYAGADAADLVFEFGWLDVKREDFAKRYPRVVLDYAKKLGRERAIKHPTLLIMLRCTGLADVNDLVKSWVSKEKNSRSVGKIMTAFQGSNDLLLEWLRDPRPMVSSRAASRLADWHATVESFEAIRAEIARRRKAGAAPDELMPFEDAVAKIAKGLRITNKTR